MVLVYKEMMIKLEEGYIIKKREENDINEKQDIHINTIWGILKTIKKFVCKINAKLLHAKDIQWSSWLWETIRKIMTGLWKEEYKLSQVIIWV